MASKFWKKIGIVGGAGPWASAYAHQRLVTLTQWDYQAVQDDEYPPIIHISEPIAGFSAKGIEDDRLIARQLFKIFDIFKIYGVDIAVIACNSLHRHYQELADRYTDTQIVNLPDAGAEVLGARKIQTAAVLCSASANKDHLHKVSLEKFNIHAIMPNENQQARCDVMIETIMAGNETAVTFRDFRALTSEFAADGAQSVISGCTELSFLAHKVQPDLPVVDCLDAALNKALRLAVYNPAQKGPAR